MPSPGTLTSIFKNTDLNSILSTNVAEVITPSNVTTYSTIQKLKIGTGGNINLMFKNRVGGTNQILLAVSDGEELIMSPLQVMATSTTALNIVAFFNRES